MILSIQSNVMHGAVGNKASLPLYQAFGIATDHLDTVRLAAHPGHGVSARDTLDGAVMAALLDDYLALPDTAKPQGIHIGYFGALDQIAPTANFISTLKQRHPQMPVMLDPVFGDHGKAYISADIIAAVTEQLMPLADIITPNQFELATLSARAITNAAQAQTACLALAERTEAHIVATGIQDGDEVIDLLCADGLITTHRAAKQTIGVSGGGDALAALYLAHIITKASPQEALIAASSLTHHMIAHSKSPLTLNLASGLLEIAKRAQKGR